MPVVPMSDSIHVYLQNFWAIHIFPFLIYSDLAEYQFIAMLAMF